MELPHEVHPFSVGTQAHPEFRSRPARSHPLFAGLIEAALERKNSPRDVLFDVVAEETGVGVAAGVPGA